MFKGTLLTNISNEISKRKPLKTPKTMILYNFPSWNSIKRKPITSFKHNNTMFKGILLTNISNEISKRKPLKTPKTMILYNFPSWNSIKRNPITSSKHNNTMFKGILLINIFNEISKRNTQKYPKNDDFIQFPLLEFYKKKPPNILQTQQYNVYRNPLDQHFERNFQEKRRISRATHFWYRAPLRRRG